MEKTCVLLIGMPGSGKSEAGIKVSEITGLSFVDMDEYIEKTEKRTIPEIFTEGEEAFRNIETRCAKELSKLENTVISAGGGTVTREENMTSLKKNSLVIFIDRPVELIAAQKNVTDYRPLLKKGEERLYTLYSERIGLYRKYADFTVENSSTMENCVNKISEIIRDKILK